MTENRITGGIFFSAVIQGENVTVLLPPCITPALSGLPPATPAFTGRDAALAALPVAPAGERSAVLVTAVGGMGGIGKTALAVQAAHAALAGGRLPGGVLFVDMFGYDEARRLDAGQALEGFLRALGVPGEHIPAAEQDRARLYASVLAAYAAEGRRILVVVDNASSHDQVRPLLPADGVNLAIVTSRDTLGLLDARLVDLDVLATADAVELLARALEVRRPGDRRLAAEPGEARALAALCGGLPLALRIVAALLAEDPARPAASVAAALRSEHDRLDELAYDDLAVHAAFDLSYRGLDADRARLFALLPANPGPDLSIAAAAALAGVRPASARRTLEALARAHLIERGGHGRWRLHDLVRLYARRLDGHDDPAAFARLLDHYVTTAQAARARLDSIAERPAEPGFAGHAEAMAWLDAEYANLRAAAYAAVACGHREVARDLPEALRPYLRQRRFLDDWLALGAVAVDAAAGLGDERGRATALLSLGLALRQTRRFDEAVDRHREAARIFRGLGDRHGEGVATDHLGVVLRRMRRFEGAIACHTDARAAFRATGDELREAVALDNLALALRWVRRYDEAIAGHREALRVFRRLGDRPRESEAVDSLGLALRRARRYDESIVAHEDALRLFRELDDRHGEGRALDNLAMALRRARRYDEALARGREALEIFRELEDRHRVGIALDNLGCALRRLRRYDEAVACHLDAAAEFRATSDEHREATARNNLARVHRARARRGA